MSDTENAVILIVATTQQAGKSTAAQFLAERLKTTAMSTSAAIAERVEEQLGLAPGTIVAVRAQSPEKFRPELIAEGDRMAAAGLPPGIVAVQRGHRVIDGIRREQELRDTIAQAELLFGRKPVVICLERPGSTSNDNTEAAALRRLSDHVVTNDGSLSSFRGKLARILDELGLAPQQRILVDVDSTLYDSDPLWIKCMRIAHNRELKKHHLTDWDWYTHFDLTRSQFDLLIEEHYHADEQILANVPYDGAAETLQRWSAQGHEIHIVSDRAESTSEPTRQWLENNGIAFDYTVFALKIDKFSYAVEHNLTLVVDDRPSLLEALVQDGTMVAATIEQNSNAAMRRRYEQIISARNWHSLARKIEKHLPFE